MKFRNLILALSCTATFVSCNFLDIMPTEVPQLGDAFKNEIAARNYLLGNCYGYIPQISGINSTPALIGTDELDIIWKNNVSFLAYKINRGELNTNSPIFNTWTGGERGNALYKAIRECYIFLENIGNVPDVEEATRSRWIAETTFLIGYYHYYLLRQYGPIVIMRKLVDMNAPEEEQFAKREPVDVCFDFVIEKLDWAIENGLPETLTSQEFGRITKLIAQSLKAEVLLLKASPIFNGNQDYANFKDTDGTQLIDINYKVEKWKDAADAALVAIKAAESASKKLYTCPTNPDLQFADSLMKALSKTGNISSIRKTIPYSKLPLDKQKEYDYRYAMVDPWNCELIWGFTNLESNHTWQRHSMLRPYVFNGLSPTLKMVETFYTKNGLPIDEDPEFDYEGRYKTAEADNYHCYGPTIKLHYNREPRFYSSVVFDRGVYELRGANILYEGRFDEAYGKQGNDYSATGYLVKKGVHPESSCEKAGNTSLLVKYPWPIIRLADLYLMYAEALNEWQGQEAHSTVINYLNQIRNRAGVPGIVEAWSKAKNPKTSFTQDEMREIIRQERTIELCYEGHRFWDVRRWKIAKQEFDTDAQGWNMDGKSFEEFYMISNGEAQPKIVGERTYPSEKYSLWPISINDLQKNKNLVQTDGW